MPENEQGWYWELNKDGTKTGRDNKIRQWAELGEFQSISDAARRVLELERDPLSALFFRVYVDPPGEKSDAEIGV
jgi:hypothetical protein